MTDYDFEQEDKFRFEYRNFIISFLDDGITIVNIVPRALRIFLLVGFIVLIGSIFGYQQFHNTVLIYIGGAFFLFSLIFSFIQPLITCHLRKKRMKLSYRDLTGHTNQEVTVSWEKVREVMLDKGSLAVRWDYGIKRKSVIVKFDKSKFDELRVFLASKMGDRLSTITSGASTSASDTTAEVQEERNLVKARLRVALILSAIGTALLLGASYARYNVNLQTPKNLIPYGTPLGISQTLVNEVVIFGSLGFACWMVAMWFVRSGIMVLFDFDKVRFSPMSRMYFTAIGTVAVAGVFYVLSIVFLNTESWLPPSAPSLVSQFSLEFGVGATSLVLFLLFGIIVIVGNAIFFGVTLKRLGNYYNKTPFATILILFVCSFVTLYYTFFPGV